MLPREFPPEHLAHALEVDHHVLGRDPQAFQQGFDPGYVLLEKEGRVQEKRLGQVEKVVLDVLAADLQASPAVTFLQVGLPLHLQPEDFLRQRGHFPCDRFPCVQEAHISM